VSTEAQISSKDYPVAAAWEKAADIPS